MEDRIRLVDADGDFIHTQDALTSDTLLYVATTEWGVMLTPSQVKALRRDLKAWLIENYHKDAKD